MPEKCVRERRRRERLEQEAVQKFIQAAIVTEGERTEYEYVQNFLDTFTRGRKHVLLVSGNGKSSPKQIYEKAETLRTKYPNATVFILIDDDDRPKKDIDTVVAQCNQFGHISADKVNCILSNRSFELWGLLHFKQQSGNLSKKELETETKNHFKTYNPTKHKVLDFKYMGKSATEIDKKIQSAIINAKAIRRNNGYRTRSTTNVDELVLWLKNNLVAKPL